MEQVKFGGFFAVKAVIVATVIVLALDIGVANAEPAGQDVVPHQPASTYFYVSAGNG